MAQNLYEDGLTKVKERLTEAPLFPFVHLLLDEDMNHSMDRYMRRIAEGLGQLAGITQFELDFDNLSQQQKIDHLRASGVVRAITLQACFIYFNGNDEPFEYLPNIKNPILDDYDRFDEVFHHKPLASQALEMQQKAEGTHRPIPDGVEGFVLVDDDLRTRALLTPPFSLSDAHMAAIDRLNAAVPELPTQVAVVPPRLTLP
jgi:hypothetical protein